MESTKSYRKFKTPKSKWSFSSKRLSLYGGVIPIIKFFEKIKLTDEIDNLFPTIEHNARKFSLAQMMLAVVLASLSGVKRLTGIATFTDDPLVKSSLGLLKGLNKDVISVTFKKLGQRGSRLLEAMSGRRLKNVLKKSGLKQITIDADSTVQPVYGNQEGAAKGYNPIKRGAKSYHSQLAFVTELKLLLNSWFRTGSAYTSNGIVEFIKQTMCYIPDGIKVFFRADSGYFSGQLFDFLEDINWDYLVKVKFKGLTKFLEKQEWLDTKSESIQVCQFSYKAKNWKKARTLKAIRRVKKYVPKNLFDKIEWVPVYEYSCYCTSLNFDSLATHDKYKERAVCETWIEQVKSQLYAGVTLTDSFWANDMLWQLSVLAYNLSIIMRLIDDNLRRQEHRTFCNWFIKVAAEIVGKSQKPEVRLYKNYFYKNQWEAFSIQLAS